MGEYVTIGIIAGSMAVGYFVTSILGGARNKRVHKNFFELARTFGLNFTDDEPAKISFSDYLPEISGDTKHGSISITCIKTRHHRNRRKRWTRMELYVNNPEQLTLKVEPEGITDKIGIAFGKMDVKTGDKDFDFNFLVSGNDPGFATRLLDEKVREKMLQFRSPRLSLEHRSLMLQIRGVPASDRGLQEVKEGVNLLIHINGFLKQGGAKGSNFFE